MGGSSLPEWNLTGVVSRRFAYPVKSCDDSKVRQVSWSPNGLEHDRAWSCAVLVVGEAPLEVLNQRLRAGGNDVVGIERFRPNLVVAGLEPHDEGRLDTVHITTQNKPVVLKLGTPCPADLPAGRPP